MNPRHDVLVIGEALIDVHDDGMTIRERVGGSAGNIAVGLARLGRDTLLHTAIGRDERGDDITAYLTASGVGLSDSSVTQGSSSVARAVLRVDGSARHDFRIHWAPAADPGTVDGTLRARRLGRGLPRAGRRHRAGPRDPLPTAGP